MTGREAWKFWAIAVGFFLATLIFNGCASLRIPKTVVYEPKAVNTVTFLYAYIQETEFGWCAYGKQEGDTLRVERIELAYMVQVVSPDTIIFSCEKKALGRGHSHRQARGEGEHMCRFSILDLEALVKLSHPYAFVICASGNPEAPYGLGWAHKEQAKKWLESLKGGANEGLEAVPRPPTRGNGFGNSHSLPKL